MMIQPLLHVRLFDFERGGKLVYWLVTTYQTGPHHAFSLGLELSMS
jgi:hypothetical protein